MADVIFSHCSKSFPASSASTAAFTSIAIDIIAKKLDLENRYQESLNICDQDYEKCLYQFLSQTSFEKLSLNIYLDVQNVYNNKARTAPILLVKKDELGNKIIDPNDSSRYLTKEIDNLSGIVQPSIGIILDFKITNSKKKSNKDS